MLVLHDIWESYKWYLLANSNLLNWDWGGDTSNSASANAAKKDVLHLDRCPDNEAQPIHNLAQLHTFNR